MKVVSQPSKLPVLIQKPGTHILIMLIGAQIKIGQVLNPLPINTCAEQDYLVEVFVKHLVLRQILSESLSLS